jgi:hypothetical protein
VPASLDDADPQVIGEAAAEDALAALRRDRLVHSWESTGASFEIVVGRGTVGLSALTAPSVLLLAEHLRRDKVTLVGRGYAMGHRTTRYDLSDGRFADRYDSRRDRSFDEYPYTVYVPGADPSGCAVVDFTARTQTDVLAFAGLTRLRGQCNECGTLRPLHVTSWRPDPAIPCPGCDADDRAPVILLCCTCQHPIRRNLNAVWPYQAAWRHAVTGNPFCQTGDRPRGHPEDCPQARPR